MRNLFPVAAAVLVLAMLAVPSAAQVVANDAYLLGYYDHIRLLGIINTGQIGSPIDPGSKHGTVCADVYIFDANQEMLACCSCPLTANALTALNKASALTGVEFTRGVVKIVADAGCDETNITTPVNGGLRAVQVNQNGASLTETLLQNAPLTAQEQQFLGQTCSFVHYLGSGKGLCACGVEGPRM